MLFEDSLVYGWSCFKPLTDSDFTTCMVPSGFNSVLTGSEFFGLYVVSVASLCIENIVSNGSGLKLLIGSFSFQPLGCS